MLENAYVCPYCMADLKGNPIEITAKAYYDSAEYFTKAIELINKGWECPKCDCRWTYEGKIIRDGIEELKDRYKTKEIKDEAIESIESIDDINKNEQTDTQNQENNVTKDN